MPDNVILNKGLESKLSTIPVQNGAITVTEDGQNLYVDFRNGVRTKITDVVILTSNTGEVDTPINGKFYYVKNTNMLFLYEGDKYNVIFDPNNPGYTALSPGNVFTFNDDGKTMTIVNSSLSGLEIGRIIIDDNGNVGLLESYESDSTTATLRILVDNRATTTITGYEVYIDTNYEGTGYGTYDKPFNTWATMEAKCLTDLKNVSKPYTIYLKSGCDVGVTSEIDGYNNVAIVGENKEQVIFGNEDDLTRAPSGSFSIINTNNLIIKNVTLVNTNMIIGASGGSEKSDDNITFINCKFNVTTCALQDVENCNFINCENTHIVINSTNIATNVLFENCKNGDITNGGYDNKTISLINCENIGLQNTGNSVTCKIINTSINQLTNNLDYNNNYYFYSGIYTCSLDANFSQLDDPCTGKVYLGTFDFNGKLPINFPNGVLIEDVGLDSLQVYDKNSRTYLPTGGNLKEHLDAIGNKFSSLDTVTGDLEELVNTIQNAYKDENTFNLETEITGEHRTGDVWKYTGTNSLTLTSTITETVKIDASTGSGSTTTTPQFTFPNAKYFIQTGDKIKVGATSNMITVTNIQGDLVTGLVTTAISTTNTSLSFDNVLELSTGDRIIWIGNGWDKLSGSGSSEIIDLGTVDFPSDPTHPEAGGSNAVLADITDAGLYKFSYDGLGSTHNEYLLVTTETTITQFRFSDSNIFVRTNISSELANTAWTYFSKIEDIKALDTRVTNAETKLSTVYKYKGSSTVANLPTSNQEIGDVYNLTDSGTINSGENEETVVAGDNVAWDGTKWDKLAGTIDVEPSISEYDTIITTQEEWDTMVASPTWGNAKKVLINSDSIIYIDNNTPDVDQYSMTVPSNVVEIYVAKNGLGNQNNHSEALHSKCSIIYEPGCTKFVNNPQNGYMIKNAQCDPENFHYIVNCTGSQLNEGHIAIGCEYETYNDIKYILDCNITSSTEINDCGFIENTGRLSELTTTAKTDLVSAINELKTNISDGGIVDLGTLSGPPQSSSSILMDVTDPGIYKYQYSVPGSTFNEYLIVSKYAGSSSTGTIFQTIFASVDGNIRGRSIRSGVATNWYLIDSYHDTTTGDVTIGGKVNTTGTRDAGNVVIGSGTTTTGDNGVIIGSAAEVTGANNKNSIAIGYEAVAAANGAIQIGQGTNSTANTTQIGNYPLLDATGKIVEDRLPNSVSGKKYSTIVIGNSASGLTANDVDYLYTSGSDFTTTLTNAINALPSTGGEIKILGGIYTLSTPVEESGALARPIKITGEGKSTIITSSTPTSYYIIASYCEISECKLATDIQITTNGYVNIHDCEISGRIYFNNSISINNIFIHDNYLGYKSTGDYFIYLIGAGSVYNLQVYNNYHDYHYPFNFLYVGATKSIYYSSIRNNYCPSGMLGSGTYSLNAADDNSRKNTMTGNTLLSIHFMGNYWNISNNHVMSNLYLYDGDYLDVINNRIEGTFTVASGLTHANITGNVIDGIATSSPYVNLGTNARFVNNVIRNTPFNTTYLPGHDVSSNKWGNNLWSNGFDRLIFANAEEIGGGSN